MGWAKTHCQQLETGKLCSVFYDLVCFLLLFCLIFVLCASLSFAWAVIQHGKRVNLWTVRCELFISGRGNSQHWIMWYGSESGNELRWKKKTLAIQNQLRIRLKTQTEIVRKRKHERKRFVCAHQFVPKIARICMEIWCLYVIWAAVIPDYIINHLSYLIRSTVLSFFHSLTQNRVHPDPPPSDSVAAARSNSAQNLRRVRLSGRFGFVEARPVWGTAVLDGASIKLSSMLCSYQTIFFFFTFQTPRRDNVGQTN